MMVESQRILVVDDEPAILRALTEALTARGYPVRQASTGKQALEIVATDPPDVVLLDLGLPDIDGVTVCRRIRGWSNVPIVVLSADGDDHRKVLALDEGANDYVTKPYSTPELLARLRALLRRGVTPRPAALRVGDLVGGDAEDERLERASFVAVPRQGGQHGETDLLGHVVGGMLASGQPP